MNLAARLWFLLGQDLHPAAIKLFGMLLIGMVLEALGIGLIIPALTLMVQPGVSDKYAWVTTLLAYAKSHHS